MIGKWFIVASEEGVPYWQLERVMSTGHTVWAEYGRPTKMYFACKESAEEMLTQVQCWDMTLNVQEDK